MRPFFPTTPLAAALLPLCLTLACVEEAPPARRARPGGAVEARDDKPLKPTLETPSPGTTPGTTPPAGQDGEEDDGTTDRPPVEEPDTPPAVATSNGTGGPTGLNEQEFTDGDGTRSTYRIDAPTDVGPQRPYGLHIHLHGDGGGGYRDFPNRKTKDRLIGVTVKAPNSSLTWGRREGVRHARYLHALIQQDLLKRYNIELDRVYFSGVSGGAYFLSGHFVPMYGHAYKSGAFLMCGGMAPQAEFEQADFLKTFRLHWQVTAGERGDIASSVRQSITAYQRALAAVSGPEAIQSSETAGNGGHCEFDGRDYTSGIQYEMDRSFAKILLRP